MCAWQPPPGWYGQVAPAYLQPVGDPRAFPAQSYPQPGAGGWYNPIPHSPGAANHTRSTKYPSLNPVLAEDTTLLRFDFKIKPSAGIAPNSYLTHRHEQALQKNVQHMRVISKSFPWQIDIMTHLSVNCEDVWMAVYNALQAPIVDSEWGFIINDKGARETVEKFMKKRIDADRNAEKHPKRIDLLGDNTLFRGLEKDDEFAKARLLPFSQKCEETWVIKLMS